MPSPIPNFIHPPPSITLPKIPSFPPPRRCAHSSVVLHSAAAYGTEWEGEDTRSDLVNVKAGITTTAAKAAREGFEGAYSDAHAGEDTRSNIVRAKGGFTTTEAAAAREGFEGAYGSEWEGISLCGTRSASTA